MAAVLEEHVTQAEAPVAAAAPHVTHAEIELRAYFLYLERGCVDGCALDDWLAAETELLGGHDKSLDEVP